MQKTDHQIGLEKELVGKSPRTLVVHLILDYSPTMVEPSSKGRVSVQKKRPIRTIGLRKKTSVL
jgi:hypothetical protein